MWAVAFVVVPAWAGFGLKPPAAVRETFGNALGNIEGMLGEAGGAGTGDVEQVKNSLFGTR